MKEFPLLYVLVFCCTLSQSLKLPDYITPCRRDDPNINACVLKSAREAIPHMLNGDPNYAMRPLDPILGIKLIIRKTSSSVGLIMTGNDLVMRGFKDVDIRDINIDFDNRKFTIDFYIPQIHIDCIYNVTGRVLLRPIDGYVNTTTVMKKVIAKYTSVWEPKKRCEKEYLVPTQSELTLIPETYSSALVTHYNGNKLLGENMMRFVIESWNNTLTNLGPTLAECMGKYIQKEVLDGIFVLVPSDNLYICDR